MRRFLVIFSSHPSPPVDMTVVDVTASCPLSAVLAAKREIHVQHGWSTVRVVAWPRGCADVDEVTAQIALSS